MKAAADDVLTPERVQQYRAELARMGWPLEVPRAPVPFHHVLHFALPVGVALLAARDSWRVNT
ncbi:hypothetical protein F6X40_19910 [Paraburkholderia sp. UCT31]|uniref:hypothetical protein n=1 Tax=Paraburkholderia sp. UCT31 TaxID=2615209 RepID=UPI0016553080|nr:hypothetical protein [Paraburkholderia sp. UCT31]MBC8739022.1 hypothetical protein [Paraburkholderia sp. UCT31]